MEKKFRTYWKFKTDGHYSGSRNGHTLYLDVYLSIFGSFTFTGSSERSCERK